MKQLTKVLKEDVMLGYQTLLNSDDHPMEKEKLIAMRYVSYSQCWPLSFRLDGNKL